MLLAGEGARKPRARRRNPNPKTLHPPHQVVEVGSHAELMAKPLPADRAPSYRGLVQRQATASVLE